MSNVSVFLIIAALNFPVWMTGSWKANGTEEHWTSDRGGIMLGMSREVTDRGTSFEFLRIERAGDSLVYQAMPSGHPPTPFPLKTMTDRRVVFENPAHDFPQRIIYWRKGAQLCGRIEGTLQGKTEGQEWCWDRVR